MIFLQENTHRHREVVDYMAENETNDVPALRAYFNGEAPVLTAGLL
jgi:hypothetical protein